MVTISRTDLARSTREIIEQVRKGETIMVQSYGEDQIVLLDAIDYRLLKAAAAVFDDAPGGHPDAMKEALRRYLAKDISLAKAAELLGTNRFELMERFDRLGIPIRNASATIEEARQEADVALSLIPAKT
ncbi:MAG: UPF0175 family protein [Chloroflexota bacterium]|nr:UPF0175 family protein [Chloroflexota bacterium]